MTPQQRYLFDVAGYLHLKGVLGPEELKAGREATQRYIDTPNDAVPAGFSVDGKRHLHGFAFDKSHHLRGTDLDYTIICPDGLTDEPGTGKVTVSLELLGGGQTSRDNLAAALVMCLDLQNTLGKCFSLLEGESPLDVALRSV